MEPNSRTAAEVLDRQFLLVRARILEIAASLDRIDRAEGSVDTTRERKLLAGGIAELAKSGPGRAERIQLSFSLPYDEDWLEKRA